MHPLDVSLHVASVALDTVEGCGREEWSRYYRTVARFWPHLERAFSCVQGVLDGMPAEVENTARAEV
jgi:hypothetical protein